jgi:uncharacterized membrane protein
MDVSLLLLLLAMVGFVGLHLLLSLPSLRSQLVAAAGTNGFRAGYSIQAAVLLVLAAIAFNNASYVPLWHVPALAWLPIVVMPVALWLVVGSLSTRNPTAVAPGGEAVLQPGARLPLYTAITRHPMLWGFLLWALAHVAANGDLAALIFFGGIAVLAAAGMLGIDAKKRADPSFDFAALAQKTSLIPFAATVAGRNRLGFTWGDAIRLAVALVLYAGLMHLHPWLFGVAPYPV